MNAILAANLLSPNFGLAFWLLLVFLLLLGVLAKYAWGPITKALDEREANIETSLQQADRALAEARKIQADNEKARREAEHDAQRILREAHEAADRARSEETEKTRERIRHMQEQAKAEIDREKQAALQALRSQVADLAIDAAEKIIRENLDQDKQRHLVDRFIDDLSRN